MDFDKKTLLTAGAALVVGLLVGSVASDDGEEIHERIAAAIDEASAPVAGLAGGVDAVKADVASLVERLEAIESSIADAGTAAMSAGEHAVAAGAEAHAVGRAFSAESSAIRSDIAALSSVVTSMASEMQARHAEMDKRRAEHHAAMQKYLAENPGAAMPGMGMMTGAGAAAATAGASGAASAAPVGARPGETVMLEDGAIRAFVSAVDGEAGTARVAVNGVEATELGLYGRDAEVTVDGKTCRVTLDGIDRGHVQLSADCGG
ncbi:hypothetical protein H0I76_11755 [Limibaculum sp. M0105]|uniref:Uncharacterized protein n=1 Tax=Thermohalobaculum xanthum TaxID=2753746 RepID=A0A8J7SG02_9RHOB|nr:hypothetical protein [Thermohalobaculum xanthum]MBK0399867.1 hypothetical protein [Thermohalobaculum xanthum]